MISIIGLLISNPKIFAYIAAIIIGRPDIADDLISICHRESRCHVIGEHKIDKHLSGREWHGQIKLKHLDKRCQKKKAGGWATHGPWGLSDASHWEYVPKCYQPYVFDIVFVSAIVAAKKYIRICWSVNKKGGWCKTSRKIRRNNIKSSRLKKRPNIKRPSGWIEFIIQI